MNDELILAFETSCDETAIAAVDSMGTIKASALFSQIDTHNAFGGVVPEVASRAHFEQVDELVKNFLSANSFQKKSFKKVVATMAPGLVGPLLVGSSYARGLASAWCIFYEGVYHLRGHMASVFLDRKQILLSRQLKEICPALVLLASGGHTQILQLNKDFSSGVLADTADDAAGECFDKSAKLMGLSYPGGPEIEKLAEKSDGGARALELFEALPKPRSEAGFSFSGLKTAIRLKLEKDVVLVKDPDFCWAIQETIAIVFERGLKKAIKNTKNKDFSTLIFCGGVSANKRIRKVCEAFAKNRGITLLVPPISYCTDNAAMIAAAAWLHSPDQVVTGVQSRMPL